MTDTNCQASKFVAFLWQAPTSADGHPASGPSVRRREASRGPHEVPRQVDRVPVADAEPWRHLVSFEVRRRRRRRLRWP